MSYRLGISDPLADSVRASAREQLTGAVARLEDAGDDPAAAVHEARKHLKKTRALLRLVRARLGDDAYRRENAALRDAQARLSSTRDADVLVATVERLAERAAGRLPASEFAALRALMAAEAAAARDGARAPDVAAVAQELRAAQERVAAWPLDGAGWETAVAGISRAYARGTRERARAEEEPTVERLHEWRKRVKDLWYHHRLLKPVWPPVVDAVGEEAHLLSELLGDDHDLAVLRARLERGDGLPTAIAADPEPLLELVDRRRGELQDEARRIAARLYAERPKAFERRVRAWVDAAAAEAGAAARSADGA
ncbi:CHAD domain-containing protein [Conexibacter arvalis]|uniref:CHAD domain-containing protein n=1 Tax=Conexibacter arvalis TaxID=912552 RepID=A0A840IEG1_9ACTN|nr:CHAD domain-containing protein [Conexibacter arvalis]MBB4662603.1 CHAD domain-containing protein [Conexibacter arvalis]